MTQEIFWLVCTVALTTFLWVPYIINRVIELGPPPTNWFPLPDPPAKAPWADRAQKAHENAVENLITFAPLAILVNTVGVNSQTTAVACQVYFFARLSHYIISVTGVPIPFRTLAFLIGVACNVVLIIALLK